MSLKVFGAESRPAQPNNLAWIWFSLDVGDVFVDPLNGATVTISGITQTTGGATSVAYTKTGTFAASPATLTQFQSWLTSATLVRTNYRGGSIASPQWPISEWDKAGLTSGELTLSV